MRAWCRFADLRNTSGSAASSRNSFQLLFLRLSEISLRLSSALLRLASMPRSDCTIFHKPRSRRSKRRQARGRILREKWEGSTLYPHREHIPANTESIYQQSSDAQFIIVVSQGATLIPHRGPGRSKPRKSMVTRNKKKPSGVCQQSRDQSHADRDRDKPSPPISRSQHLRVVRSLSGE